MVAGLEFPSTVDQIPDVQVERLGVLGDLPPHAVSGARAIVGLMVARRPPAPRVGAKGAQDMGSLTGGGVRPLLDPQVGIAARELGVPWGKRARAPGAGGKRGQGSMAFGGIRGEVPWESVPLNLEIRVWVVNHRVVDRPLRERPDRGSCRSRDEEGRHPGHVGGSRARVASVRASGRAFPVGAGRGERVTVRVLVGVVVLLFVESRISPRDDGCRVRFGGDWDGGGWRWVQEVGDSLGAPLLRHPDGIGIEVCLSGFGAESLVVGLELPGADGRPVGLTPPVASNGPSFTDGFRSCGGWVRLVPTRGAA